MHVLMQASCATTRANSPKGTRVRLDQHCAVKPQLRLDNPLELDALQVVKTCDAVAQS